MGRGAVETQEFCGAVESTAAFFLLQVKIGKAGVVVGTPALWPAKPAFGFIDDKVIDARNSTAHQAAIVELPVLVSVGAIPLTGAVPTFVGKTNSDPVAGKCPKLFD